MNKVYSITISAIPNIPLIEEGSDLGQIIADCARSSGLEFQNDDILVVASKVVSKAEGRVVPLASISPSEEAIEIGRMSGKDPRRVEVMMREGKILKVRSGRIETLHRLGFVCTSSGTDMANTGPEETDSVSLLPENPDRSAGRIQKKIKALTGKDIGVIINDSLGAKYRRGSIGMAVGLSNVQSLILAQEGEKDLYGRSRRTCISFADEVSAAASLLMGQGKEGRPAVLVRGLSRQISHTESSLNDLIDKEHIEADYGKGV